MQNTDVESIKCTGVFKHLSLELIQNDLLGNLDALDVITGSVFCLFLLRKVECVYIKHKTIDLLKNHIYSKNEAFRE